MPIVPLGTGSYKRNDGFVPEVVLRNMYLEKDESGVSPDGTMRIQRPGLRQIENYNAPMRGIHYRAERQQHIAIAGSTVYANSVASGSIPGTGRVLMASTAFATYMVSDAVAYRFDTGVTPLPLPDDAPDNGYVQDVDQLNGYGLFLQRNGRFYWLVPGASSIEPLDYATAESLPDMAVALIRLGDEFWILGQQNVEVWQPTGDLDLPFQRASGRNFERGCLHRESVCRFDNTVVWVGDDYQVYRASSVPQVISNPGITERVRKATGECVGYTFGIDGHSFYALSIPSQGTFVYDASTQAWSEFTWPLFDAYQVDGVVRGAWIDGRVFAVEAEAATDDGLIFERAVTATIPIVGKPPRNDSVSIGTGSLADTVLRLRWKDGQDQWPAYYDEIQVRAPLDVATLWRLGRADQPYRSFEISSVAPERIRIAGMTANQSWGG